MQCGPRKGHKAPHCHPGWWWGAMVLSPALAEQPCCASSGECGRSSHCKSLGLAVECFLYECHHLSEENSGIQMTKCIIPFMKQGTCVHENWKVNFNPFHKMLSLTGKFKVYFTQCLLPTSHCINSQHMFLLLEGIPFHVTSSPLTDFTLKSSLL